MKIRKALETLLVFAICALWLDLNQPGVSTEQIAMVFAVAACWLIFISKYSKSPVLITAKVARVEIFLRGKLNQ